MKSAEEFLRERSLQPEVDTGLPGETPHQTSSLEPSAADGDYAAELRQRIEARAVSLLASREHGALELRAKLMRKFPENPELLEAAQEPSGLIGRLVDEVIEHCQANRWQSDERYIEQAVRNYMAKGHGPMKIRQKLQQSCRDSGLIDAHLDLDDEDWLELAREALLKKYGDLKQPASRNEQAKRMRFLQGRGFPPGLIWKAFR